MLLWPRVEAGQPQCPPEAHQTTPYRVSEALAYMDPLHQRLIASSSDTRGRRWCSILERWKQAWRG